MIAEYRMLSAVNRRLTRRSRRNAHYCRFLLAAIGLFECAAALLIVCSDFALFSTGIAANMAMFVFILVMDEVAILTSRMSEELFIAPDHLFAFPLADKTLYAALLLDLLFGEKGLVHLFSFALLSAHFIPSFRTFAASVIALFLFYVLLEVWLLVLFLAAMQLFKRLKMHLSMVFALFVLVYNLLFQLDGYHRLERIPFWGWVGTSVELCLQGHFAQATLYLASFVPAIATGMGLGVWLYRVNKTRCR
ncbi:MAG TPA: hypothetical protein PKW76_13290 [bacterium]|nr:hypothetical protein [bacterium]HPG46644.1 hypothetical protein [bacterium]HPM98823.1 hypothetical protein [bacterium]